MSTPDYHWWLRHVLPAGGCSKPIRLKVEAHWLNDAGTVVDIDRISHEFPDGQLYVACKNRRASVCPGCAQTYRADMYQLVNAGLVGGKGVPASVVYHPCFFITLPAPSFGPVHSVSKPGKPRLCRPRRTPETCPHGVRLACFDTHTVDDPAAGEPLCLDCYQHAHQAVWNLHASELWRRTTIALTRGLERLARSLGTRVRLSYTKVAEYQRRGAIHYHAMVRIDGLNPHDPSMVIPPDPAITDAHIRAELHAAITATGFTTAPHPRNRSGWPIAWGDQIDIRTVHLSGADLADDGQITTTAVAGYLAKYATKATEDTGFSARRVDDLTIALFAQRHGDCHQLRQLQACWHLGQQPLSCTSPQQRQTWANTWGRLQRWAHMLGYGGHFATKSRRYSTTLTALREVRRAYQRGQHPTPPNNQPADHDPQSTPTVLVVHQFTGVGWLTTADAELANTAAALARERRQTGREEMAGQ